MMWQYNFFIFPNASTIESFLLTESLNVFVTLPMFKSENTLDSSS